MIESIQNFFKDNIQDNDLYILAIVLIIALAAYFFTQKVLLKVLVRIVKKSKTNLDDIFLSHFQYKKFAILAPVLVLNYASIYLPDSLEFIGTFLFLIMAIVTLQIVGSALDSINEIYNRLKFENSKPIKGYIQLFKILIYLVAAILIYASLTDRSAIGILSGIGAFTAILLLIFRDTILSFVASLQINSNDLIRIGDWIEVPKFGVDGDVIDIALHTIKIQNWDKTITTIPTHKIIDESFKNYRGMIQSGGRRIKRSIYIDVNSVRFLHEDDIKRLKEFDTLKPYLETKEKELTEANKKKPDINNRRLTNIGTIRAYIELYLHQHPNISKEMTLLVRQLASTPNGIPIELYAFTNTTNWTEYEIIQADIFDHIFAIINVFDLKFFQTITKLNN